MKHYALSAAVNLAVDNYLKNLRRAFPSTPWTGVQHYAEKAWFAADEPGVPWDRVEARLRDAWSGHSADAPISVSAVLDGEIPSHHDAVTGAEYEEWSVGRRFLHDQTKSGRDPFRDPHLDYGSHG